ncbi:copper homeostasis protein CutC [Vibrio hippocampi]|uniref:PF03932 family protein CutC n=1 Tax=Vibrio hippocampi TaxID=654686 RepID=A0ABM8ZF33_9VIBR|nr:copper homeostasis protein CutC [Vibrio hippocampi]CAH0524850.1 Copper homeostasis protein CutC [Vibrio hippocampi]
MTTHYQIEVCIDNIESLNSAVQGGATRIELCSSLALGGLTPSMGFIQLAAQLSTIPIYAMIRPRQGDFLYSDEEVAMMEQDIKCAAEAGASGIVLGLLNKDGNIDMPHSMRLTRVAKQLGLGITFHRAFDQCRDAHQALEDIIALGCERLLTSGLATDAMQGCNKIHQLHQQAQGRIEIMAGAGVNEDNVAHIVKNTGINEVHLSGKSTRPSKMQFVSPQAKMGNEQIDDFAIPITSKEKVKAVVRVLQRQQH